MPGQPRINNLDKQSTDRSREPVAILVMDSLFLFMTIEDSRSGALTLCVFCGTILMLGNVIVMGSNKGCEEIGG